MEKERDGVTLGWQEIFIDFCDSDKLSLLGFSGGTRTCTVGVMVAPSLDLVVASFGCECFLARLPAPFC